jgi:type I restriction enzyme S subunit
MKQQMNTPKLRFPQFKGEWEKKKLGEVAEINPSNKSLPERFVYIDLESVSNGELLKENEIVKNEAPSRAQRILKENDVLFQMVRPYQMNNLFFNKKGNYVASTGYAQIRTLQNSKYVFQYLHFQKFVDKVIERCTGTSYPAINSTDLSNIEIYFPTFPEQTKIAEFFTAIDTKIQALKTKKEKLQQYKKGVMQQLFSQELRFKDENGKAFPKWEMKKLGEVCEYKNGGAFENQLSENGKYFLISLNSLDITGKLKNDHKRLDYTDNSLQKGDLVMVLSDVAHGNFLGLTDIIPADNYVLNQRMGALKPKLDIDRYYLKTFINLNQKYFKLKGQGSSQQNLSKGDIEIFELQIPSLPEQTKIANFLSSIDEKINHTETQIQQTQAWKKGLLQKMFV